VLAVFTEEQFVKISLALHLGSQLNHINSTNCEIQARIISGNRCYYSRGALMKSRVLHRSLKLKIYNTLIRPAVTYGCEAWTLTSRYEQQLRIFERKILRKILAQYKMKMDSGESERTMN